VIPRIVREKKRSMIPNGPWCYGLSQLGADPAGRKL